MEKIDTPHDKAEELLAIALEIIQENGNFDLPMRELATRARVSLRTPYEIFGSKPGIVRAILAKEHGGWRKLDRQLPHQDIVEHLFQRLGKMVAYLGNKEPLYRALFRATQVFSGGQETEAARHKPERIRAICAVAVKTGVLVPEVRPAVIGHTLTDIYAANMREWAHSDFEISDVEARVGFGWAASLAGVATPKHAPGLRRRAMTYHEQLRRLKTPRRAILDGSEF